MEESPRLKVSFLRTAILKVALLLTIFLWPTPAFSLVVEVVNDFCKVVLFIGWIVEPLQEKNKPMEGNCGALVMASTSEIASCQLESWRSEALLETCYATSSEDNCFEAELALAELSECLVAPK